MDDTRPVPLCPGGKYEILPGMIWISSGFLHGGKLQENPPYRAVPKWTDGFQILMGGTFSFDNGYCLNEVLEGWDYWESLVGKTEKPFEQCVIHCPSRKLDEPNPYDLWNYHGDQDPDDRIAHLACGNNNDHTSNPNQQPDEDPGVHNMAQQNTDSDAKAIDIASTGESGDSINSEKDDNSGGTNNNGPVQRRTKRVRDFPRSAGIQVGASE